MKEYYFEDVKKFNDDIIKVLDGFSLIDSGNVTFKLYTISDEMVKLWEKTQPRYSMSDLFYIMAYAKKYAEIDLKMSIVYSEEYINKFKRKLKMLILEIDITKRR